MNTDARPAEIEETAWAAPPAAVRRLVLGQQATVAAVDGSVPASCSRWPKASAV